jgi:hypothetical protein
MTSTRQISQILFPFVFTVLVFLSGCNPAIINHAAKGNYDGVIQSLNNHPDSLDVQKALCVASREGNLKIVQLLVQKGVNPNFILRVNLKNGKFGSIVFYPPLSHAIDNNHLDVVKYLVENGASVEQDSLFWPLYSAISTGSLEIADYLISKGADPNAIGAIPNADMFRIGIPTRILYFAAGKGDISMVGLLKSKGAVIPSGKVAILAGWNARSQIGHVGSTKFESIDGNIPENQYVAELDPGSHIVAVSAAGAWKSGSPIVINIDCKEGEIISLRPMSTKSEWKLYVQKFKI